VKNITKFQVFKESCAKTRAKQSLEASYRSF